VTSMTLRTGSSSRRCAPSRPSATCLRRPRLGGPANRSLHRIAAWTTGGQASHPARAAARTKGPPTRSRAMASPRCGPPAAPTPGAPETAPGRRRSHPPQRQVQVDAVGELGTAQPDDIALARDLFPLEDQERQQIAGTCRVADLPEPHGLRPVAQRRLVVAQALGEQSLVRQRRLHLAECPEHHGAVVGDRRGLLGRRDLDARDQRAPLVDGPDMPIMACSNVGLRLSSESSLSLRRPPSSVRANEGRSASFAASRVRNASTTRCSAATQVRPALDQRRRQACPDRGGTGTKSRCASTSAAG
jgi:hypothetical protein